MSGRVVVEAPPPKHHHCQPPEHIGTGTIRPPSAPGGQTPKAFTIGLEPKVGTVWQCECGKTFVAIPYRQRYRGHWVARSSEWVPESRWARWREG